MQTSGRGIRLFVEGALTGGTEVSFRDPQTHYLINVMRVRVGDRIALFNGKDGEWQASIVKAAKHKCIANVDLRLCPQRLEVGPWLVFAPLRKTCMQFLVEKATELGVSRILPVITRHTARDRISLQRLKAHAIEAAEQCHRLTLPEIAPPVHLGELLSDWSADRQLFVMDCRDRGDPFLGALLSIRTLVEGGQQRPPGFLVGPEGGFAECELDDLASLPFAASVRLGSRILRAETAALAALACWQAVVQDRVLPLSS